MLAMSSSPHLLALLRLNMGAWTSIQQQTDADGDRNADLAKQLTGNDSD